MLTGPKWRSGKNVLVLKLMILISFLRHRNNGPSRGLHWRKSTWTIPLWGHPEERTEMGRGKEGTTYRCRAENQRSLISGELRRKHTNTHIQNQNSYLERHIETDLEWLMSFELIPSFLKKKTNEFLLNDLENKREILCVAVTVWVCVYA